MRRKNDLGAGLLLEILPQIRQFAGSLAASNLVGDRLVKNALERTPRPLAGEYPDARRHLKDELLSRLCREVLSNFCAESPPTHLKKLDDELESPFPPSLHHQDRAAVILHKELGLSAAQIAPILKESTECVERRIQRAN